MHTPSHSPPFTFIVRCSGGMASQMCCAPRNLHIPTRAARVCLRQIVTTLPSCMLATPAPPLRLHNHTERRARATRVLPTVRRTRAWECGRRRLRLRRDRPPPRAPHDARPKPRTGGRGGEHTHTKKKKKTPNKKILKKTKLKKRKKKKMRKKYKKKKF